MTGIETDQAKMQRVTVMIDGDDRSNDASDYYDYRRIILKERAILTRRGRGRCDFS